MSRYNTSFWPRGLIATMVTGSTVLLGVWWVAPLVGGAVPGSNGWSVPSKVSNGGGLRSITCPTATFCMAVGSDGSGPSATGTALMWRNGKWSTAERVDPEPGAGLTSVACVNQAFCVAVDSLGYGVTFAGAHWSPATNLTVHFKPPMYNGDLVSVACASTTFCVAVSGGGTAISFVNDKWARPLVLDGPDMGGLQVSCPSKTYCLAVDASGYWWTDDRGTWSSRLLGGVQSSIGQTLLSCASGYCVALASQGGAAVFNGRGFSKVPRPSMTVAAISCPVPQSCMALAPSGEASVFNGLDWSVPAQADSFGGDDSVSCAPGRFCMAVDASGHAVGYQPASGHGDGQAQPSYPRVLTSGPPKWGAPTPRLRPPLIDLTINDPVSVDHLVWYTWGLTRAEASGTLTTVCCLGEEDASPVAIALLDPLDTPQGFLFDKIWISANRPIVVACPPKSAPTSKNCHIGHKYPVQPAQTEEIPAMEGFG